MSRLLKLSMLGTVSFISYFTLTKFETNITIKKRDVRSCLFGKVDIHVVNTNQGKFILKNKFKSLSIGPNFILNQFKYGPIDIIEETSCHITGYGLDLPQLHLHRIIISQNGTPCNNNHCEEKLSFISQLVNKF